MKRITHLPVVHNSYVFAIWAVTQLAFFMIVFGLFAGAANLIGGTMDQFASVIGSWLLAFLIAIPLLFIFTFIAYLIIIWLLNLVLKWTGGIELEMKDR